MANVTRASHKDGLPALLEPFGQEHLLRFWERLTEGQCQTLASQIASIDFARVLATFRGSQAKYDWAALARRAESPPAIRLGRSDNRFESIFSIAPANPAASFHTIWPERRCSYLDDSGQLVEPTEPNAIKFEQFIFDLLPTARNPIVVEVDEASHFAPVKNVPGSERDSPEKVQAQMIALHRRWLEQAGANVALGIPVEISPLFAIDADEVRKKFGQIRSVTTACYLE